MTLLHISPLTMQQSPVGQEKKKKEANVERHVRMEVLEAMPLTVQQCGQNPETDLTVRQLPAVKDLLLQFEKRSREPCYKATIVRNVWRDGQLEHGDQPLWFESKDKLIDGVKITTFRVRESKKKRLNKAGDYFTLELKLGACVWTSGRLQVRTIREQQKLKAELVRAKKRGKRSSLVAAGNAAAQDVKVGGKRAREEDDDDGGDDGCPPLKKSRTTAD